MEILILYFSGTGNSKLISQEIRKRLMQAGHSVELLSIEDTEKLEKASFENKVIGFGFPVYKFTYPDIFNKLFPLLNEKAHQNPVFLACTYARFTANVFYDFSKKLDRRKFRLVAASSFKSPSNGISARLPEDAYDYQTVMFFEDEIAQKLDAFTAKILHNLEQGEDFRLSPKHDLISPLRLQIVKDIERTKYPKLQIDHAVCEGCGLCAAQCPDDNLKKIDGQIFVIDQYHCLHCLRCMNHCPQNAISFGKLTQGENRYTLKIRNELYKKAANGHKEPYWADFYQIRSKWRRKTIQYWLTHMRTPELG